MLKVRHLALNSDQMNRWPHSDTGTCLNNNVNQHNQDIIGSLLQPLPQTAPFQ